MDTLTYWNGTWHEGNPAILGPRGHEARLAHALRADSR